MIATVYTRGEAELPHEDSGQVGGLGGRLLSPCGAFLGRFCSLVTIRLSDLAVRQLPEVRGGLSDTV